MAIPPDDSAIPEQPDSGRLRCFVIGPIGNRHEPQGSDGRTTYEEALEVWEEVIEPACSSVGLTPVRADGLSQAGEITDQIFRRLRDDDVVIADLTGANANVMYELGLRHTRNRLTLQVGEYGRLPFDVNVVRTVLFSRSPRGLINARNELIQLLESGLAGQYDPVSATRVWLEKGELGLDPQHPAQTDHQVTDAVVSVDEEPAGFLDLVAEGEERQGQLLAATEAIGEQISASGQLAETATAEMEKSDARGGGMRGRLAIAARFADGLDAIATRLEQHVSEYEEAMTAVSSANLAIIERLEEDPDQLDEATEYGMATRQLAAIARESMESLGGMSDSMQTNAKMSRVLRAPTKRIVNALARFSTTTQLADEWDRRLQALGIPLPPEDWEFDPPKSSRLNGAGKAPQDSVGQDSGDDPQSPEGTH